jgi:predicted GNAT family N-acyltransferase
MMGKPVVLKAQWADDSDTLMQLRTRVFVEEQNVSAALEIDGKDSECQHVKAIVDGLVIGTGRLLPNGFIGRMCVLAEYRNRNIGTMMLENLVQQALDSGHQKVLLNAQSYIIPFYQKFGFRVDSEEFIEAGILHRRMVLNFKT